MFYEKIHFIIITICFWMCFASEEFKFKHLGNTGIRTKTTFKETSEMNAIIETSMGTIKIKLLPENAPLTVENFVELAEGTKEFIDPQTGKKTKKKYYDGLIFHRVIPEFMIQGGDPTGTGRGGRDINSR